MKTNFIKFCLAFWLSLLLSMVGTATASAKEVYTLTEQELTQWQTELNLQKNLVNKQMQNEKKLQQELLVLKGQLKESQLALNNQQTIIASSQQALTDANKRLIEFAREEKSKLRKAKWQRNTYVAIMVIAAGAKVLRKIKH